MSHHTLINITKKLGNFLNMAVKHYTIKLTVIEESSSEREEISNEELSELAKNFSSEQMIKLGKSFLNLNVSGENIGNQWTFNYNLLKKWMNQNKRNEPREVRTNKYYNYLL